MFAGLIHPPIPVWDVKVAADPVARMLQDESINQRALGTEIPRFSHLRS
jgi:hypothetical protein